MAGGKWMVKLVKAGETVEVSKYFKPKKQRRKGKAESSAEKKKAENQGQAVKRLARLINANFHHGDVLLTLKFDSDGMERIGCDHDVADHQMMLFLRRCAYAYKKRKVAFRYIGGVSEKSSKTLEPTRLHCHVIVSGDLISKPEGCDHYLLGGKPLDDVWGLGTVDVRPLRTESDYSGLALYIVKQVRGGLHEKKWRPSRNLIQPTVVEVPLLRGAISDYNRHKKRGMPAIRVGNDGRLLVPVKAVALEDGAYIPALGSHYIRFAMPTAVRKRGTAGASPCPTEKKRTGKTAPRKGAS